MEESALGSGYRAVTLPWAQQPVEQDVAAGQWRPGRRLEHSFEAPGRRIGAQKRGRQEAFDTEMM